MNTNRWYALPASMAGLHLQHSWWRRVWRWGSGWSRPWWRRWGSGCRRPWGVLSPRLRLPQPPQWCGRRGRERESILREREERSLGVHHIFEVETLSLFRISHSRQSFYPTDFTPLLPNHKPFSSPLLFLSLKNPPTLFPRTFSLLLPCSDDVPRRDNYSPGDSTFSSNFLNHRLFSLRHGRWRLWLAMFEFLS